MKNLRMFLASPFLFLGIAGYRLAEVIVGEKFTYRAGEVLNIMEQTAECTKCGHKGTVFYKKARPLNDD